ncbi:MAG: DUF1624 domain-containing protein [Bacteroidales bacterium]|nr:DUF1624 domain-containing protein [Bacteroidales bacterium]
MSIDAIRGFDMFWIVGGEHIVHALAVATSIPFFKLLSHNMNHVDWEGFVFYDMIFPLFLFISGVTSAFSVSRKKTKWRAKAKPVHTCTHALVLADFVGHGLQWLFTV